jgi:hypothetical protein
MLSSLITSLRFSFAFYGYFECYGDFSPIVLSCSVIRYNPAIVCPFGGAIYGDFRFFPLQGET